MQGLICRAAAGDLALAQKQIDQSSRIPALFTTLPHLTISALRNATYSAGASVVTSIAWRASCSRKSALAAMRLNAARSLSATSRAVPAGASTVYHDGTSTPLTPLSSRVGTSGASGERAG